VWERKMQEKNLAGVWRFIHILQKNF
jgi:hypothetical protein